MGTTVERIKEPYVPYQRWAGYFNLPLIYSEVWMLSLVLKWFSEHKDCEYRGLSMKNAKSLFSGSKTWHTESQLISQFAARPEDKNLNREMGLKSLSEGYTQPDAVYGDFAIGSWHQFVVVAAKMKSLYSNKVTHAPGYNQVSRTVACMAKVIAEAGRKVEDIEDIAFYTLAPKDRLVKSKTFEAFTNKADIESRVNKRIEQYKGRAEYADHQQWQREYFLPLLDKIKIELISWEEVISFICEKDSESGAELQLFYDKCKTHNKLD